jgi:hypothetical protein
VKLCWMIALKSAQEQMLCIEWQEGKCNFGCKHIVVQFGCVWNCSFLKNYMWSNHHLLKNCSFEAEGQEQLKSSRQWTERFKHMNQHLQSFIIMVNYTMQNPIYYYRLQLASCMVFRWTPTFGAVAWNIHLKHLKSCLLDLFYNSQMCVSRCRFF